MLCNNTCNSVAEFLDLNKDRLIDNIILEENTWTTELEAIPYPYSGSCSSVLDNKIYVIGGRDGSLYSNKLQVYDTENNSWEIKANTLSTRARATAEEVGGKIYLIGGRSGNTVVSNIEAYSPDTDTWEVVSQIPSKRAGLASSVVDGKIYCIGGYYSTSNVNTVEAYDPLTNTWETKTSMPLARSCLSAYAVGEKIYCFGGSAYSTSGYYDDLQVYDTKTDTWEIKASMPTPKSDFGIVEFENKIYCIGGFNGAYNTTFEVDIYDVDNDSWSRGTSMSIGRNEFVCELISGKIYCIGGTNSDTSKPESTIEVYILTLTPEEIANNYVIKAEQTVSSKDILLARSSVNKLCESQIKEKLQNRLNKLNVREELERKTASANLDLYIKCENMLQLSLDTNSITFEDFSGIEDVEKVNAVNITINSSLPYQLNAYLPTEIQNADKSNTMDKQILNIKENSESAYQTFANTSDKIVLKDNCPAGNNLIHGVDIKLKGGIAHEKDVYKTIIKFEAEQK